MKNGQLEKAFKAITKSATKSRPILGCLHVSSDGSAVVTDSHRLLRIDNWAEEGTQEMTLDLQTFRPQIDASYPDTSRLIPTDFTCTLKVESTYLEKVMPLLKVKTDQGLAKISFAASAEEAELKFVVGSFTSAIPVKYSEGLTSFEITLNAKYLYDAFEFFKAYNIARPLNLVTIGFRTNLQPFVFKQDEATYLVMPVRRF